MDTDGAGTTSDRRLVVHAVAEIASARDLVRRATGDHLPPERVDDVVLATSELVSNALEHGTGGDVEVHVSVAADAVELCVTSPSAEVPRLRSGPAPAHAVRGRGLSIVDTLADRMRITGNGGEVAVTCRFDV